MLANGQGKTSASRHGTAKPSSRWSLFFLSAGEESLMSLMARAGQSTNAGQEIRLADIGADAEVGMGIFEDLHNQLSPASMALSLKQYTSQYHGAIAIEWLRQVVANQPSITRDIGGWIQNFVDRVVWPDSSGQIIRVARRFALVAVAGELASQYGLIG